MENGIFCTTENCLNICVDWIAFTVTELENVLDVMNRFGLDLTEFESGMKGANGYKSRLRHSVHGVSVLYDGKEDMGVHVSVSGEGVSYFMECFEKVVPYESTPFGGEACLVDSFDSSLFSLLCKAVLDVGHFTRLDIAVDDLGANYFSVNELADTIKNHLYLSQFRKIRQDCSIGKNNNGGNTIYFGDRSSALMLRVYDKKAEQEAKNKACDLDAWVRWEIELHKERANFVAALFVAGKPLPAVALGIFRQYLRLIVRDNVRDDRCSTDERWEAFLNGVEKMRICSPVREKSLREKKEWVMKQVGPTLAAIVKADGGDLTFVYALLDSGSQRLSPQLIDLVREALRKAGYDDSGIV